MNNDLNKLKELLLKKGIDEVDLAPLLNKIEKQLKDKRYGLIWENKDEDVYNELLNKLPILTDIQEKEIKTDKNKPTNLLIEGDNLHSLRSLQYTHKNSINLIYIDPPYNTGNKDFKYNDRYIDKEDTWRHSCWLSFISKRLELAKELLTDDGVIFISIDDNEFAQLKLLCDEIFGENNFITNIVWKKGGGKSDAKYISNKKEYILCYKNKDDVTFNKKKSSSANYKLIDDLGRRYALRGFDMQGLNYSKSLDYPIECPDGTFIYPGKSYEKYKERKKGNFNARDWCWTLSKEEFNKRNMNGDIVFKKQKEQWRVYYKSYYDGKTTPFDDIYENVGNQKGSMEIKELFNNKRVFDFSKPVELIKFIINLYSNKNAIVLDFFAGSGTTGHAVLELNKEDGGNRQFILCTNNENNICEEITYQRLNKVINGYTTPKGKEVEGLDGNLKYYKTQLEKDFDDIDNTIDNIIAKCTSLISIKENCYNLLESKEEYDIISNEDKLVLIHKKPLALNYEVKEVANVLSNYEHKNKIIYTTNIVSDIKGITLKEYPKELIEQQKNLDGRVI